MIRKTNSYGNSAMRLPLDMHMAKNPPIPRKRLVEECLAVSIDDLRRVFGKKALIIASNNAKPIKYQLGGQAFEIYVLAEPHNLPRKNNRTWDDSFFRVWLVCLGCCKRARKLFTFPSVTEANVLADLRCRWCHALVYQSQRCGGTNGGCVAIPSKNYARTPELLQRSKPKTAMLLAEIEETL
jgi:hypothetical protein